MSIADDIREFVYRTHLEPQFDRGMSNVQVRAGDIHQEMLFVNRMPAICSALGGKRFSTQYGVQLVERSGPVQGANVYFQFRRSADVARGSASPPQQDATLSSYPAPIRQLQANDQNIYLVSCVSVKQSSPCAAKDLYISPWFIKARHFVEATGSLWYILSAKHGLVHPQQVIEPYDVTLNSMKAPERKFWAHEVLTQIETVLPIDTKITIFAGQRYRQYLVGPIRERGIAVDIPMEGLRIGEQLAWFDGH